MLHIICTYNSKDIYNIKFENTNLGKLGLEIFPLMSREIFSANFSYSFRSLTSFSRRNALMR